MTEPPPGAPRETTAEYVDRILAEQRAIGRERQPKTRTERAEARGLRQVWLTLAGTVLGAVAARWVLETMYRGGDPAGTAVVAQWTQLAVCCAGWAVAVVAELRASVKQAAYDEEGRPFASGSDTALAVRAALDNQQWPLLAFLAVVFGGPVLAMVAGVVYALLGAGIGAGVRALSG